MEIDKQSFRKQVKSKLLDLQAAQKGLESVAKCVDFIQSEDFLKAKIIFGFMPLRDEVDVLPILRTALEQGKKVLIPKIVSGTNDMDFYFVENDLYAETVEGAFGIYEPTENAKPVNLLELSKVYFGDEIIVLVPGIAFGNDNSRLGRGLGFYDKFLAGFANLFEKKKKPVYIGVCYRTQIFPTVPHTENDIFMDKIM